MTLVTELEVVGDRAVVVKRASGMHTEALRREGERLLRASHPGVVEVLRSAPVGDGWELRTAHAGRSLSVLDRLTVPQVAGIIAAVASTLADLHQIGLVHGRLEASRVLIGDHGGPVLCGFGPGEGALRPEDDVAALGALLGELLGRDEALEPIPEQRWRRRPPWAGWDRRALLLLADQAAAEPATRRPTARRLASAITQALPERTPIEPWAAALTAADASDGGDAIETLRGSAVADADQHGVRPLAAALAGLGALLLAAGLARASHSGDAEPERRDGVAAAPASVEGPEVHTGTPVNGSLLAVAGRRYRVGQEGDQILVEDWDCDGTPTPALLRPSTGEVYVFDRWAAHASVEAVAQVHGAVAIVSEIEAGACPTMAVRIPTGELVPVLEATG